MVVTNNSGFERGNNIMAVVGSLCRAVSLKQLFIKQGD